MRLSGAWDEQIFTCKPALEPGGEPQAGSEGWLCPWCKAESGSPRPALAQALVCTLSPTGVGSLVTQPRLMNSSGPRQAPQSIPQPTPAAGLAVLGMETSSSSTGSPREGKDMSQLFPRAPRGGRALESTDREWWQERLSSALGDAPR